MLYMEDFLELIEPFPQEIRERLTEMREIDLQIQNESDKLDSRVETFFQSCKKQKQEWKTENFEEIKKLCIIEKEYLKLFENADEKVQIANQLYELIEKYIKKLDQELQKFKLELEADHAGITSKLEQVVSSKNDSSGGGEKGGGANGMMSSSLDSLGLNFNATSGSGEDSDFFLNPSSTSDLMLMLMNNPANLGQSNLPGDHASSLQPLSSLQPSSSHKRKHSSLSNDKNSSSANNLLNTMSSSRAGDDEDSSSSWNSLGLFNLPGSGSSTQKKVGGVGGGASSITMSSGQPGSTKKSTASLLPSTGNRSMADLNMLNLLQPGGGPGTRRPSTTRASGSNSQKRSRDRIKNRARLNDYDYDDESSNLAEEFYQTDETGDETNEATSEIGGSEHAGPSGVYDDELITSDEDNMGDELGSSNKFKLSKHHGGGHARRTIKDDEWGSGEDTNEKYCICKDVSYGDMIMCDNVMCGTQWFHFVCVGLNSAPKGKWFCPSCTEKKKKRAERQQSLIQTAYSGLTTPSGSSLASSLINQQPSSSSSEQIASNNNGANLFITPTSFSSHN